MEIKDCDDLIKLAQACRKSGIDSIEIGDIKVTFRGEIPRRVRKKSDTSDQTEHEISYTADQLIDWSAGGVI